MWLKLLSLDLRILDKVRGFRLEYQEAFLFDLYGLNNLFGLLLFGLFLYGLGVWLLNKIFNWDGLALLHVDYLGLEDLCVL